MMNEGILGIIPARYESSRFPGKPLVVIDGKTMIRRVYEQACKSTSLRKVVVATDHETIFNHVRQFGGEAVMTSGDHLSGTSRCREASGNLAVAGESFGIIINIQGDEPYIHPEQIDQVATCFDDPAVNLATLVKRISDHGELVNPNVVKVVTDRLGFALLFSRAAIPYVRGKETPGWINEAVFYKHIGIYGYRRSCLEEIADLPESALEQAESLEQLRWLENGYRILTRITEFESMAVDTPEDLLKIINTNRRPAL